MIRMPVYPRESRSRPSIHDGLDRNGVLGVEMKEHGDEEEEQERDAVKDKDIGGMGDVCLGEEKHLFFGGAHKKETGGIEEL